MEKKCSKCENKANFIIYAKDEKYYLCKDCFNLLDEIMRSDKDVRYVSPIEEGE